MAFIVLFQLYLLTCFEFDFKLRVEATFMTINLPPNENKFLPIYSIIFFSNILEESSGCRNEINFLQQGLKDEKLWSLKILDSSGEPSAGFIYGNNYWLGYQRQCIDLNNHNSLEIAPHWQQNNSIYRNPDDEFPPFEVNYFVARFQHNSTIQYHFRMNHEDILFLGLCLPASCTKQELGTIMEKMIHERQFTVNKIYPSGFKLLNVLDLKDNYEWALDWHIIAVIFVLVAVFVMSFIATGYDVFIHQKQLNRLKVKSRDFVPTSEIEMIKTNSLTKSQEILLCLSAYTNSKKLFNIKTDSDSIEAMNGLRFIGMIVLIYLHVGYYGLSFADNEMWLWRLLENLMIGSSRVLAFFVVDTFFFLSGFLSAWLHFKTRQKEKQQSTEIKSAMSTFFDRFIKRIIRLTPVYLVMICITQLSFTWATANSIFISYDSPDNCSKYWWRNLLYIHNFFGLKSMCMSWSWYLSNDMQFYIVAQILLLLSDTYFKSSCFILFSLLGASILLSGYISYINNLSYTLDDFWFKADIHYFPPWTRIAPYIIGIIAGYFYQRTKDKLNISKRTSWLLWIISCICLSTVLVSSSSGIKSITLTAIYLALSKTIWAIGIGWLLIACQTNNARLTNEILSSKILKPLGNMTYCAYLLNPVIINVVHLISETPNHIDIPSLMISTIGFAVMTYFFAYLLTVTVEMPYVSVHRIINKPWIVKDV
ncbi:nose resistant to fluoxetine protein 6-like [Chelonus insularis]|uniref:nose resistant to fluoxetine protein 6-like n=1 Tax=Chelonus insularis TaxID=460826 RepID=UPI00158D06EC|nr:nose resistant to fluoxetine protein 6-like [Chelonus insularis]